MKIFTDGIGFVYQKIIKPILFKFDPEVVHENFVNVAEFSSQFRVITKIEKLVFNFESDRLSQTIDNVYYKNPIGLAAGFDYDAKLTQSLSAMGFGFQTVGTITNLPYEGNPRPMLGRLPKSKSLMVNKGFKNPGADKVADKLKNLNFEIPLGISIGRTNSNALLTQKESVDDIISAFIKFENASVANSYYELNISCPNLFGDITFYPPQNLSELLHEVDSLHLQKPIYIKMPIDKTDSEVLEMLDIICKHKIAGVIFGNLQKNRKHEALHQDEVKKFLTGNFSGKPTFIRSNELIALSYKDFGTKLTIIGCGGVFNAHDAYTKIKAGASLVQLITGLVFEGPQLISQINRGLDDLLKKDGYKNISEAIGNNYRI